MGLSLRACDRYAAVRNAMKTNTKLSQPAHDVKSEKILTDASFSLHFPTLYPENMQMKVPVPQETESRAQSVLVSKGFHCSFMTCLDRK